MTEYLFARYPDDIADAGAATASELPFVPAAGVAATNVQTAIEEVAGDVTAHLADTVDAHDASAISNVPAGTIAATTVQAAIDELAGDAATDDAALAAHIADTSAAHAASAIAFTPAAGIAATEVQAAIVEDAGDLAAHLADAADAHAGSAITNTPAGNIAATTVQAAINELDGEKSAVGHTHASTAITDFTEAAEDAIAALLVATEATGDIDWTYVDGTPALSAIVKAARFSSPGAIGDVTPARGFFTGTGTNDSAAAGTIGELIASRLEDAVNNANATATLTIANPCVGTWVAHGFAVGAVTAVKFTTTGTLPNGGTTTIVADITYYLKAIDANTFNLATTVDNAIAGTFLSTAGGSQSGTHTADSRVFFVSATRQNIAALRLTAGSWSLSAAALFFGSGTTVVDNFLGAIRKTSAATAPDPVGAALSQQYPTGYTPGTAQFQIFPVGPLSMKLAAATTIYLVMESGFSASTIRGTGYIAARRVW